MKFKFNNIFNILYALMALFVFNNIYAVDYIETKKEIGEIPLKNYIISHKNWIKTFYQQDRNLLTSTKCHCNEPSSIYRPNFYEINELSPIFSKYSYIRENIERPVSFKSKELIQNIEFIMTPHFNLIGAQVFSNSNINVSLELKALFF
ncbi:hypothetical protein ACWNT8_08975 [Pigmentibacter ruber]|uniref:hypothetical protein n=1 Tax=Pigmentibacter ruber TaxID=2683196 RepID=UPI00131DA23F|nr:hypothetical protein [Pigmentibacter ruber]